MDVRLYYGSTQVGGLGTMPRIRATTRVQGGGGKTPDCDVITIELTYDLFGATWSTQWSTLQSAFASGGSVLEVYNGAKGGGGSLLLTLLATSGVQITGQPWIVQKPTLPADLSGVQMTDAGLFNVVVSLEASYVRGTPTSNATVDYSTATSVDAQGQTRVAIRGVAVGSGAATAAAARALGSGNVLVNQELDVDAARASVRFSYMYQVTASCRSVKAWSDSVDVMAPRDRGVVYPLIGGTFSSEYVTHKELGTIRQSGSAVGISAYPTPPTPTAGYVASISDIRTQKTAPVKMADGNYSDYGITWSYTLYYTSSPGAVTPTLPP
jgi:hypothetical protein